MYFDTDAELWWRTMLDEVGMGICSIETWDQLKAWRYQLGTLIGNPMTEDLLTTSDGF